MADIVSLAKRARVNLAKGLNLLQHDGLPSEAFFPVAELIADAMGELHFAETTPAYALLHARNAQKIVRRLLALAQQQDDTDPVAVQTMEVIAQALGDVFELVQAAIRQQLDVDDSAADALEPYSEPTNRQVSRSNDAVVRADPVAPSDLHSPSPVSQLIDSQRLPPQQMREKQPDEQRVNRPPEEQPEVRSDELRTNSSPEEQPEAQPVEQRAWPLEAEPMRKPLEEPVSQRTEPVPDQELPSASNHTQSEGTDDTVESVHKQQKRKSNLSYLDRPYRGEPLAAIDAELGMHSATNFYQGLEDEDIFRDGGLFIATYNEVKEGQLLQINVALPGGYEFEAVGKVVWIKELGSSTNAQRLPPGFGVRFQHISPEARRLVYRYVRNREPLFYDVL